MSELYPEEEIIDSLTPTNSVEDVEVEPVEVDIVSTEEEDEEEPQPTFEDVFQKLLGTIFKQVASMTPEKDIDSGESISDNDDNLDDDEDSSLSAPSISDDELEEEEKPKIPQLNDVVSLFGKTTEEIDGAIANIGASIKTFLSDVKKNAEIKTYFLEQLETCNLNDAKKNTFEKFELPDKTDFTVSVTITQNGIKQTL